MEEATHRSFRSPDARARWERMKRLMDWKKEAGDAQCSACGRPLHETETGRREVKPSGGKVKLECSDCFFSSSFVPQDVELVPLDADGRRL